MRITDIKQQQRRTDRYSIYIDDKYSFSLSENELLNIGIRIGQQLTGEEAAGLKQKAILDKAYDRALNLISRRARSEWELSEYMKRKNYPDHIARTVLAKLRKGGYVDDGDFARRWVENRRLLKATSKRRLIQELKQKRVSDEVIEEVLAEDETDEREILKVLIGRKRRQTKYQDDLKLMQYLSRQGYGYEDIRTVLRELKEE